MGHAEISKRVLEETHDEFNPQDPLHCIINPAHRDDFVLHLVSQNVDELGIVKRNHDLQQTKINHVSTVITGFQTQSVAKNDNL